MAEQSIVESLRKLDKEKAQIGVSYKRFSINSVSVDKLQKDINNQKSSNLTEDKIKGIGKEIALSLDDNKNQHELISQLKNTCQMNAVLHRVKKSSSILIPNIYLIGYIVLSIISILLGFCILHFGLILASDIDNKFLNFLIHLAVYTLTFIPLHIYSNHAPKGKMFMITCTTILNILMIALVNKFVSYHFGKSFFIISIIVMLIMSFPALLVGYFSLRFSDNN